MKTHGHGSWSAFRCVRRRRHSGTSADDDLYVRWSNVAADPNVTSGERTYRQGSDRPCAGLRWPRTANPAFGQSLHLPSGLHDAHPLWRTPRIRTVIDIEVVSQHANAAADVTTAQHGVPLQALQAPAPTTILNTAAATSSGGVAVRAAGRSMPSVIPTV